MSSKTIHYPEYGCSITIHDSGCTGATAASESHSSGCTGTGGAASLEQKIKRVYEKFECDVCHGRYTTTNHGKHVKTAKHKNATSGTAEKTSANK